MKRPIKIDEPLAVGMGTSLESARRDWYDGWHLHQPHGGKPAVESGRGNDWSGPSDSSDVADYEQMTEPRHCPTCVCSSLWEIATHHLIQTVVIALGVSIGMIVSWLLYRFGP